MSERSDRFDVTAAWRAASSKRSERGGEAGTTGPTGRLLATDPATPLWGGVR